MLVGRMKVTSVQDGSEALRDSLKEKELRYEVIRSRRRTLAIAVEPPARVVVRAPYFVSQAYIAEIVGRKARWIEDKLRFWQEARQRGEVSEASRGGCLPYLGEYYPVRHIVVPGLRHAGARLQDGVLCVWTEGVGREGIKAALQSWYRDRASEHIAGRVSYYVALFSIKPVSVKVKEQKKRWGSCTADNKLLFNWRCIMAPEAVLDYVVVHELCHLPHKNHSPEFWQAVADILPDYALRRSWLRENGINLDLPYSVVTKTDFCDTIT